MSDILKLDCNHIDKKNAIHGLVYNKKFVYERSNFASDSGSVTIRHKALEIAKGFPFYYEIRLTYNINSSGVNMVVNIDNKDENAFPFTLGWHPYFSTLSLENSTINFKSNAKFLIDNQQIISGKTPTSEVMPYSLKDVKLDDGYKLETNTVEFVSPEYKLTLESSSNENFLQLYTPNQPNSIAIEPMTGVCDSFNNKIGLQILYPNDTYCVKWDLAIETF